MVQGAVHDTGTRGVTDVASELRLNFAMGSARARCDVSHLLVFTHTITDDDNQHCQFERWSSMNSG